MTIIALLLMLLMCLVLKNKYYSIDPTVAPKTEASNKGTPVELSYAINVDPTVAPKTEASNKGTPVELSYIINEGNHVCFKGQTTAVNLDICIGDAFQDCDLNQSTLRGISIQDAIDRFKRFTSEDPIAKLLKADFYIKQRVDLTDETEYYFTDEKLKAASLEVRTSIKSLSIANAVKKLNELKTRWKI